MICILVEDKIGVMVLRYCYHKSGLVPSTPSGQFRDNFFVGQQVATINGCQSISMFCSYKQRRLCIELCELLLVDSSCVWVSVLLYCIMRWHCIVSLLDSMLILLTVNRAMRLILLCVMCCKFILVEASMYIEYNCVLRLCF